ncbi:MAG TPA: GH1 family beta-glucosidase [Stellaceae bacterium]|nr:GH1 family beta-glucosidase [Stellaceae bacterium]
MHRRTLLKTGAAGMLAAGWARGAPAAAEPLRFPPGFVWGVSTSSCQIEGRGDRKADSIWDSFARIDGTIGDHTTPEIACDSYHRYPDDVALLAKLGVKAYRYSISWPRVLPEGTGQPDARGLDYYDRVTDALLKARIEPWVCLFHWDLPQALQDRGGWGNRDIAGWFADYAVLMARRLGDRVKTWAMFNEPQVHAIMGHGLGEHAPGLRGRAPMAAAGHHQNLAQGRGLAALRAAGGSRFTLGTVMSLQPVRAAQNLPADKAAAETWDAAWNRAYLDPLFHGSYPAAYLPLVEKLIRPGDIEQIRQPVDFLGVNYYAPMYQRSDPNGLLGTNWGALPAGMQTTGMTWGIDPSGLTDILGELRDHYGNPRVYVTENGAFFAEPADAGGHIDDRRRISYLRDHIATAHRAIAAGVNLHGYFIWTLVDNWEWAHGFSATFGLARLDRSTLARVPKASFDWFAGITRSNTI